VGDDDKSAKEEGRGDVNLVRDTTTSLG